MNLVQIGRALVIIGAVIMGLGLLTSVAGRLPGLGRLPGDILINKGNFTFYFPVVTCLVLSLVLTIILTLVAKLFGTR